MNVNQHCDSLTHESILPAVELEQEHGHSHRQQLHRTAAHHQKDLIRDLFSFEQCSAVMEMMELDPTAADSLCFDVFAHQRECHSADHRTRRGRNEQASVGLDYELQTNEGL